MADVGAALYSLIQTKSAITSLVSTRVFPTTLPQTNVAGTKPLTLPAVTYQVVSHVQTRDLSGASANGDYLIQIDLYGSTRTSVVGLSDAIRNALNNHSGAAGSEYVKSCFLQQQIDGWDAPADAAGQARYRITQDWRMHIDESTS